MGVVTKKWEQQKYFLRNLVFCVIVQKLVDWNETGFRIATRFYKYRNGTERLLEVFKRFYNSVHLWMDEKEVFLIYYTKLNFFTG